jgi:xanthine/CO dehydrogenase XdhC/CoxF family maturation factor
MRAELGMAFPEVLQKTIHAPPGLLQGTHSPESIALSIVADIESHIGLNR